MEKVILSKAKLVEAFHDKFLIENNHEYTLLDEKTSELRYNLIKEENEEYLEACKNGDIVEIADALGDILYIAFGSLLKHGLQYKIDEVFDEIHRSNMSKLDKDGKPIFREDGKVLKSELYFRPDIKKVLGIE
jgi:predicted HAD superfamily Cof-like phosphohydrolase